MATNFHVSFTSRIALLLVIVFQFIEHKQINAFRLSSLCPSSTHAYRLVRTAYGLKCVATKRLEEKKSPKSLAPEIVSPLESKLWEYRGLKPIIPVRIIDHAINLVAPTIKSVAPARYKKVIIKNNRGPWKIDNQILVKSPERKPPKQRLKYSFFEEQLPDYDTDQIKPSTTAKPTTPDGLLVNPEIVNESVVRVPKLVVGSWMKMPEVMDENVFSSYGGLMRHESSTKIPRIVAATIERNSNNLLRRSWRDTSEDQTPDLMQDDSIINIKLKRNILGAFRNGGKKRYLSNGGVQLKLDFPSGGDNMSADVGQQPTRITPIKIYVFLNRNQSAAEDYIRDIASGRLLPNTGSDTRTNNDSEFVTPVSASTNSVSTPAEEPIDFDKLAKLVKDVLRTKRPESSKKLTPSIDKRKDVIDDVYAEHLVNEGTERVDDYDELSYTETTTTLAPLSRNWNFDCGDRKGFFADTDNNCRAYYQCSVRGRQRFECPPNTRFNQYSLICDWSDNVSCEDVTKDNAMDIKDDDKRSGLNATSTTTESASTPNSSSVDSVDSDEYYEDSAEE